MGAENTFIKKNVPVIFRKPIMDITIYVFIEAQKFTIPSISITESAKAYMTFYNISEEEYALISVIRSYERTRKQIYAEQKNKDGKGPFYL